MVFLEFSKDSPTGQFRGKIEIWKQRDLKAYLVAGSCDDFEGAAFSNELDVCSLSLPPKKCTPLSWPLTRGQLVGPSFQKKVGPYTSSTQAASLKNGWLWWGGGHKNCQEFDCGRAFVCSIPISAKTFVTFCRPPAARAMIDGTLCGFHLHWHRDSFWALFQTRRFSNARLIIVASPFAFRAITTFLSRKL